MIGQTVSHYRILKKLGESGMGEVSSAARPSRELSNDRRETPCSDLSARVIRDGESGNALVMGNLGIQSLGLGSIQLDLQAGRLGWEE